MVRNWHAKTVTRHVAMIIDLHIHSKSSDGELRVEDLINKAKDRNIDFMSITDHDSIECQNPAVALAERVGVRYVTGVELNVTFSHPRFRQCKPISLDFLGYQINPENEALKSKLEVMAKYREERATKILHNLNVEFEKEGIQKLTKTDLAEIEASVDGVLGRPHIAEYLVKKKIVVSLREAFDKYLVKCDVPKYPLNLEDASKLVRNAGGKLVLAHPNDSHGTSLAALTKSLPEQTEIVKESMLAFIDGVECWHSRNDAVTTQHYVKFAKALGLLMTGGSDCHQKPIIMGTVQIPDYVADQFNID
jgi:predicted metal-dependent phosphoesterase TrpH